MIPQLPRLAELGIEHATLDHEDQHVLKIEFPARDGSPFSADSLYALVGERIKLGAGPDGETISGIVTTAAVINDGATAALTIEIPHRPGVDEWLGSELRAAARPPDLSMRGADDEDDFDDERGSTGG